MKSAKGTHAHSTSSSARLAEQSIEETIGVRFQTEVVLREDVVIPFTEEGDSTGQTLGEMLDRHLMHLAAGDGEPHAFTFTFDAKSWKQAKPLYLQRAQKEGWSIRA